MLGNPIDGTIKGLIRNMFHCQVRSRAFVTQYDVQKIYGYLWYIPCISFMSCFVTSYEIPSKFALIKYVLECASDVGCCMKPAKTIGDSQKSDTFLIAHACAFCGVGIVFA